MRSLLHVVMRLGVAVVVAAAAVSAQDRQGIAAGAPAATPTSQREAAAAQSASLSGRVVSASDGTALGRALIAVTTGGRVRSKVLSDSDGGFAIEVPRNVPYNIAVTKAGYLGTALARPPARAGRVTLDVSLARPAVIAGFVADPRGHPVVSIRILIEQMDTGSAAFKGIVVTDDLGNFRVAGLSPGKYTLNTIASPEYPSGTDRTLLQLENRLKVSQPSSDTVTVEATSGTERDVGLTYRDSAVILPYALVGGTVTGRVTDDAGEPAQGLAVQLWRIEIVNGQPKAQPYGASRPTDDRGAYRLFHIKAGRYVLVVTDESSMTTTNTSSWLPVYYPGTVSPANGVPLTIGRSQELPDTDVAFTHVQGARVFGLALNAASRPLRSSLSLIAADKDGPMTPEAREQSVDADGLFAFESVPPGDYAVRANVAVTSNGVVQQQTRDPEFALQRIQVLDSDVGPLAIRTEPPATLRGRIVFEGGSPIESGNRDRLLTGPPPAALPAPGTSIGELILLSTAPITPRGVFEIVAITNDPLFDMSGRVGSGTVSTARIDASAWTFELPRLAGPVRLRLGAIPPGVWLKSAYIGDTNLADSPFTFLSSRDSHDDITIVIASTAATVTGRTTSTDGRPLPGAHVIVFSTHRERWHIGSQYVQALYSGDDGRFTLSGLPPGDYNVVSIDSVKDEMALREPDLVALLESLLPSARRVTLGESQVVIVSPRTVTIPQ